MVGTRLGLPRARLLERVASFPAGSVVFMVAGGGSGKTTLLTQWLDRAGQGNGLVALEESIDRPALATAILAASGVDTTARRDDDVVPLVIERASGNPTIIAFDNVDRVKDLGAIELLGELVARWPWEGTLVLSGRTRPDVPLLRHQVGAPVRFISGQDLSFDSDELELLDSAAGYGCSHAGGRAGGWPAGSLLPGDPAAAPSGWADHYLRRDVLDRFDDDELDYLGQVAALAPAPPRVLDIAQDRGDTALILSSFIQRGLPMVEVSERGRDKGHVTIPDLFTDYLVDRLERRHPGRTDEVVRLAATLVEAAGEIDYLLALLGRHGQEQARRAVPYRHMATMLLEGRGDVVASWLDGFDDSARNTDPVLALPAVGSELPLREEEAREVLAAHAGDHRTVLPDGTTPAVAVARLLTALGLGAAPSIDPTSRGPWRQTWGLARAWDLYAAGHLEPADRVLAALEPEADPFPLAAAVGRAKRSIIALDLDEGCRASELHAEAKEILAATQVDDDPRSFLVDVAATRLARQAGDLDDAQEHALAVQASLDAIGDTAMLERVTALVELARLTLEQGGTPTATQARIGEATVLLDRWRHVPFLRQQLDRVARGIKVVGPNARTRITAAEKRVLQHLPSHYTLPQVAELLEVSYSTVKSQCLSLYRKLEVRNRADAVEAASRLGLLTSPTVDRA